ncbi:nucleoporin NUP35 [Centroberyx gerrardi]
MDLQAGSEPMTLGSPTSPKPGSGSGAQFLPGFLMGDLPAPASPQPRPFSLATPTVENTGVCVCVRFPPASASYILLQFAQYGNILKHTMASPGNWMHLQYQSRLQARKALSKDGKVFGDWIMVGVKPCIDKSVMEGSDVISPPPSSSSLLPSTPRSSIRPLSAAYRATSSDYQVVADRQTPRKDDSFVSKAMEYMFGW